MIAPEILVETKDVRVRIMSMAVGEATAWHHHTAVTDRMVCLEGPIAVECRDPEARYELHAGGYCTVPVARVHRVVNLSGGIARYLLVQGVGRYDFNQVES